MFRPRCCPPPPQRLDSYSDAEFLTLLEGAGIPQGSGNLHDYERGKGYLQAYDLEPLTYQRMIRVLSDWVGV